VNGDTSAPRAQSSRTVKTADFNQLELPTVLRNRQSEEKARPVQNELAETQMDSVPMKKTGTDDMDFLDIPAFLRRQAD
jgi:cell division protein FtsZ